MEIIPPLTRNVGTQLTMLYSPSEDVANVSGPMDDFVVNCRKENAPIDPMVGEFW